MNETEVLIHFGVSIVLGALVGLERERHFDSEDRTTFAGIRTFSIVCLFGAVCGYLSEFTGPWIAVAGLLAVAAFSIATFLGTLRNCDGNIGTTTELAFIFTFLVGVVITMGSRELGIALGIALTFLLSMKTATRKLTQRVSREDIYATLKFAIISFVILPFLPHETFDPWDVLSLYNIWLMVVLVSGISFTGYMATKWLGGRRGLGLTALLGGLWSSTATTMTFANRCRQNPVSFDSYALGVLIACSTMFPRQIIEVYVAGPAMIGAVLLPLGVMGLFGLGVAAIWYYRSLRNTESQVEMTNPFSLMPALKFAAIYAAVLVISRAASDNYGAGGVYAAAILTGLVDVNAITLSAASLVAKGQLPTHVGVLAVVLAAASNTIVKAGITLFFGSPKMFKKVLPWFAAILALGGIAVFVQSTFF